MSDKEFSQVFRVKVFTFSLISKMMSTSEVEFSDNVHSPNDKTIIAKCQKSGRGLIPAISLSTDNVTEDTRC